MDQEILTEINDNLKSINHSLRVILCCSLLPKDGPNWKYYEDLFRSAEIMIDEPGSLSKMVEDILSPQSFIEQAD